MLKKRNVWAMLAGLVVISVVMPFVFAAEGDQAPGQGGPGGPGGFGGQRGQGGQGGMGRGDMQAQTMERAKTELAATEDAWKKIEPLLTKVVTLNNELSSRGMRGGRQGQGQQPPAAPEGVQSEIQKATMALRALTQDDTSSMDDIKAKLAALRTAKEKAKADLTKAQDELKKAVDARQEAKLVLMGMLN